MNTKISLFFGALLLVAPLANAKPDKDDSAYTDKKVAEVNGRIDSLKGVVNDTKKQVENFGGKLSSQAKEIAEYKSKIDELTKSLSEGGEQVKGLESKLSSQAKEIAEHKTTIDELTKNLSEGGEQVKGLESKLSSQAKEIAEHKSKIDELTDRLNETRNLLDKNLKEIKKLTDDSGPTPIWAKVLLWLLIPFLAFILAVLGFAFWPRKTGTVSSSRSKCPRCGWEHDPGDTVCKNPNCKTQF